MTQIVDGKKIADEILSELKGKVSQLKSAGVVPQLVVILVGQDPASVAYVKTKQKSAQEIGIRLELKTYPESASQAELQSGIKKFNTDPSVHGILVQLPLPKHLSPVEVLNTIAPQLDVDCLTETNKQALNKGGHIKFLPPAPAAILKILDVSEVDLTKANVLLVGSGDLVGKPLAAMLLKRKVNFRVTNRRTDDLAVLAKEADVIISGVGKPELIRGEIIKEGCVVIDAGTAGSESGEVVGDIDIQSVSRKARLLAAVPGGVGPVTVAMLLRNLVESAFETLKSGRPSKA